MTLLDAHVKLKDWSNIGKALEFSNLKFLFLLIAGVVILIARRPEGIFRPQFFGEDGLVFFREAYQLPFYQSLFAPYAGYYHFLPRLFAEIATLLPIKHAPLFYNTVSLLVASLCLSWIYLPCFRRLISKDWVRLMLVFFFLLLPNQESLMKLSYLQWYVLLWTTLCCFMELPGRTLSCFLLVLGMLIASWTIAISFIFIPIFILNIIRSEDNKVRQTNLFFLLAAVLAFSGNLLLKLSTPAVGFSSKIDPATLIHGLINGITYKVICSAIFSSSVTYWLFKQGWILVYIFSFAFLLLIFIISMMVRKRLSVSILALVYIIISSVVSFSLRPSFLITFAYGTEVNFHDRYFFLPTCVFCLLIFIIVSEFQDRFSTSTLKKIILSAIVTGCIALQLTSFKMLEWTPYNLHWNKCAELISAKENEATAKQKTQTILIPINPKPNVIELQITPRMK